MTSAALMAAQARAKKMTLTAPAHLIVRMSRWTPQALRDERDAWMLARAREGYTGTQIAESLRLPQSNVAARLRSLGYRWHDQTRRIRRNQQGGAS